MNVYTFSKARQQLSSVLEHAKKDGEVQIKRRDGQLFVIKPVRSITSPLDVPGIDLKINSKNIVDIVREMRERV